MELTDGEKLILVMLADIYERLGVTGDLDPKFIQRAIYDGHGWALKWKYPGVFDMTEPQAGVVHETVEILAMWLAIERSYGQLSPEDQARVTGQAGFEARFLGFDGNSETEYMSVARFPVDELDRFAEFKGRDFNSHYPSLDAHRRMLQAFNPRRSSWASGTGTVEQLATVLREQIHPSRR